MERLSKPGPIMHIKNKETIKEYAAYSENKLMASGDIETQPGPEKSYTLKLVMILLLLIVLNQMKKTEDSQQLKSRTSPNNLNQGLNLTINILKRNNRKKFKLIKVRSRGAYLVILLLIAGDIQPNPGPEGDKCLKCKQLGNRNTTLTCETCSGWCHITCYDQENNNVNLLNSSFQWLCPNPTCQPNHHAGTGSTIQQSTNRFKILKHSKFKAKKSTSKPIPEAKKLLKQLPNISSKEYIGKEICKACHNTVGKANRAVSCDLCSRWTHLKCSDMALSTYKGNMCKEFPWICNTCRTPETEYNTKIDLTKLKPEQLPITASNLQQSQTNGLLLLHYNCRSMINKVEEIHHICNTLKPSIMCLTETWLDSSSKQGAYTPDGYTMIREDRSEKYKQKYGKNNGGGIAVLHKEDLKIQILEINSATEETLWLQVKCKQNFILGVVYRASYTNLLTETTNGTILEEQLNQASIKNNKIIVLGDFNCDTSSKNNDKNTSSLNEIFDSMSMVQHISKPTRIDLKTHKSTTIDHVWNNPEMQMIEEAGTIEGISDHVGIYVKTNITREKPVPNKIRFRSYRNYSPEKFNIDLNLALTNTELENLIENEKVDEATKLWTNIFIETAAKHAPIIEKDQTTKSKNIPWFSKDLENLISEKKTSYNCIDSMDYGLT